jgi:hypothetical protein
MLLGVRFKLDAACRKATDVLERFQHTLTCKPIQSPHEHDIKLSPRCPIEQPAESIPIAVLASGMVYVLSSDRPALPGSVLAELDRLVFGILPGAKGGNSRIDCYAGCGVSLVGHYAAISSSDKRRFAESLSYPVENSACTV